MFDNYVISMNLSDRIFRNMAPVINYIKFDHYTILNVQGYHGCIQPGKTKKAVNVNQASPNPFTGFTRINYSVTESQQIEIYVSNAMGQKVITLQKSLVASGDHEVIWNGTNDIGQHVQGGLYFLNISGAKEKSTLKLMKN
jgi:hypothetical protein